VRIGQDSTGWIGLGQVMSG